VELTPAGQHEFNNAERTSAHRLVATGMLVTGLVIAINQNWWKHAEGWTYSKTHSNQLPDSPTAVDAKEVAAITKWLIGLGGTWVILTLMVDLGDTADLAVAIALVLMGSVVLTEGPTAISNLGISTSPTK
jgi:hypothetical protein